MYLGDKGNKPADAADSRYPCFGGYLDRSGYLLVMSVFAIALVWMNRFDGAKALGAGMRKATRRLSRQELAFVRQAWSRNPDGVMCMPFSAIRENSKSRPVWCCAAHCVRPAGIRGGCQLIRNLNTWYPQAGRSIKRPEAINSFPGRL